MPPRDSALAWLLALSVLAAGCEDGNRLPDAPPSEHGPETERPTPTPAEPNPDPVEVVTPISPSDPLSPGAREVELSVNGERVRVVRPSLRNPFVVAGGEFDAAAPVVPPNTGSDDAPRLTLFRNTPIDVIRRVPQTVELSVADTQGMGDITGYLVEFEGYEGHFLVGTEIDSEVFGAAQQERGRVTLGFFMDEVFPPGAERDAAWASRYNQPFGVTMRIRAVDRAHHMSAPVEQRLNVLPVGRGDLEVTLSMSQATDLDLYVVEPNSNVIYYANMQSFTRGQLDLDANAACSGNTNVRYEHIFWPEGSVPEGTYQIRVDNWANCVGGSPVDFEVIVQNCGDITVYQGNAAGMGGRGDCRSAYTPSCQSIATVEVRACEPQL